MVIVNVWNFRGKTEAWGHASCQVDQNYISWWPERPGLVPSKVHRNIYVSNPFRNRSFEADVHDENQQPDHVVMLAGLDEGRMKDWWQGFGLARDGQLYEGPLLAWDTLMRNCSNVVATALKEGGGDRYASWSKSWNLVWTPADVLAYALSIAKSLGAK